MTLLPSRRLVLRWLADGLFLPLAVIFALAGAAFGCSGSASVSTGNNNNHPNRAHGTYRVSGTFAESASSVYFGYWTNGNNTIDPQQGQALQQTIGTIQCRATITIVPNSILYEETATETSTGRSMTVSMSGTWSYDGSTRLLVNWGAAIVTTSTFSTFPPYSLTAVGTQIQRPQSGDLIFANSAWTRLSNVVPGPLNGVFVRIN
jgi:hypothetical protein